MIIPYLIDTLLAESIKELPFVERYGGVVQTLTSKQLGQDNKTKIKKYPVSCAVTEKDCNDTTLYSELVPDQSKKSIVYWELTSPMQSVGETPNLSQFTKKRFRGTARLVVWLNLQELGHKEIDATVPICQGASYTVPSVFKALSKNGNILGGQYAGNRVQIEPNKIITDLNTIFGKYDYPDDLNYYLYPFSFYAVDVNFTMDVCLDNDFVFPVYDPIKCIDYSGGSITPVLPFINEYSMSFDGFNEAITIDNAFFNIDASEPFTFSAWVKIDSLLYTNNIIVSKYQRPTGYFMSITNLGQIRLDLQNNGGIFRIHVISDDLITLGTWGNVTVTYDGSRQASGVKIYINGVESTTQLIQNNLGAGSISNAGTFNFGAVFGASTYLDGFVNDFRAWDIVLSAADVLSEYNGGTPTTPTNEANLLYRCAFGDGATFNGVDWVLPDEINAFNYNSVNMDLTNRVTDKP